MSHITIRLPVGTDKQAITTKLKAVAKSRKTTSNKLLINYILKLTK